MSRIWAIAINTFREAIRNKMLYALLCLALFMIGSGLFLGKLSLNQEVRIIQDLGLFCITLFGTLVAVFIGVNLLYQEVERRTAYVLLSKPLRRAEFVLGKYVGMLLTLGIQVSIMALAVGILLLIVGAEVQLAYFQAISLAFVELALITSIAIFFSSFTTPYLSGFFTFSLFVLGRVQHDLVPLLPKMDAPLRQLLWAVTQILPDLHRFDLTVRVIHNRPVSFETLALTGAYGLSAVALLMTLAILLFSRKDFM